MTDPVAKREFSCVNPNGERFELTIQLGRPSPINDQADSDWRCLVTVPFVGQVRDVYGIDSSQALCLALTLVYSRLEDFIRRGGKLYHPGTTDLFDLSDIYPRAGDF